MKATDILFCIFNYHEAANAEFLYRELRPSFDCHIIDADSGQRPDPCNGDTVYLPNVYYSGMMHHAITMAIEGNYPYMFFICSDVQMSHECLEQLKQILLSESFDGVGVYSSAHADDSYTCLTCPLQMPPNDVCHSDENTKWPPMYRNHLHEQMNRRLRHRKTLTEESA